MQQGYIYLHNNIFPSLFALSEEEQSRGLMFQEPPAPIMSFVYSAPQINKFWMKATPAPLDIVFCHRGKVSEICYGEPLSTKIIGSNLFSDLVIELPYGTVKDAQVKIGHSAGLVKPTLDEMKKIVGQRKYF